MMSEIARQFGATVLICGQIRPRNWWGSTKIRSVESATALDRSGSATTLSVNLMPCATHARAIGKSRAQLAASGSQCVAAHRQILDILVLCVDDVGEVLAIDLLLEDPHADLLFELAASDHVAADDLRDRRSPVPRADNRHLLLLGLPATGRGRKHERTITSPRRQACSSRCSGRARTPPRSERSDVPDAQPTRANKRATTSIVEGDS